MGTQSRLAAKAITRLRSRPPLSRPTKGAARATARVVAVMLQFD